MIRCCHSARADALTCEAGTIAERRSFDPFGQRRNPIWGQPTPASFSSKTTKGFTGHESDDELGLINMKGRIYDPKVGRFLTTDPIVSAPLSGQSWNPYSYVFNNPLSYVDPSGFKPDYQEPPVDPAWNSPEVQRILASSCKGSECDHWSKQDTAEKVGAAVPPVDVSPTGNTASYDPQPTTTTSEDWSQTPQGQFRLGLLGGLPLGAVPFAGVGEQFLDTAYVLPYRTGDFRHGLAIGQIFGGLASILVGATGGVLGAGASATGIGAPAGVAAIAISTTLVLGGIANIVAGVQALTTGSGSSSPPAARGGGGSGSGSTKGMGGRTLSPQEQSVFDSFSKRAASAGLKPSPYRTGSWGRIDSAGRYQEVTRIDIAEAGQPGWRGQTHMHVEGVDSHLPLTTKIPGEP